MSSDIQFTALGPTHIGRMRAIRATYAFDGTRFLPGGAAVLLDGDRIVGVETVRVDVPEGVEVTEYAGEIIDKINRKRNHISTTTQHQAPPRI